MFCTMNIPIDKKHGQETNEECFLRIIDTFMGEYPVTEEEFSYLILGQWVEKYMKKFDRGTFPVAWIEEDGNIKEYFVIENKGKKVLYHKTF